MEPNTLRRSLAPDDLLVANNYPGCYPVEDWSACYWTVDEDGGLTQRRVTVQLPLGFSAACLRVVPGQPGCIRVVRRWGFGCYPQILNEIGFDFSTLLSTAADDGEWMAHYFRVVTFDLPGYFIIASPAHPFLLYAPDGQLKGSYTQWRTQLGALAYLVANRDVSFVGLQVEDETLYQQALGYLLDALRSR